MYYSAAMLCGTMLADVIGYLLENEEDCITSPKQYLSIYDQPYDVILDSGRLKYAHFQLHVEVSCIYNTYGTCVFCNK